MKFDVYSLDMWSDDEGGWTQNNQMRIGKIEVCEMFTEKQMLTAMKEAGFLRTDDRRMVYVECPYGIDVYEVCAKKRNEPLFKLVGRN